MIQVTKKLMLGGVVLLAALVATPTWAQGIVFINSAKLVQLSPQGKKMAVELQAEVNERRKELEVMQQKFDVAHTSFENRRSGMNDETVQKETAKLRELQASIRNKQQDFEDELKLQRTKRFAALEEIINKAIATVAQREKYDAVFDQVIYVRPGLEITDAVLEELGKLDAQ